MIFTAGLPLIYCLNFDLFKTEMHEAEVRYSLDACNKKLQFFKKKMPDAGSFPLVFELLRRECLKNRNIHTGNEYQTVGTVSLGSSVQSEMLTSGALPDVDLGS